MRRTIVLLGCILSCLLTSPYATAQIGPQAHLEGSLSPQTGLVGLGHTTISGKFQGVPIQTLLDTGVMEEMNAFPLFGSSILEHLDTVFLIENIHLENITSLDDILTLTNDTNITITPFTHATLTMNDGFFALGMSNANIQLDSDLSYAMSALLSIDFGDDTPPWPFLLLASPTSVSLHYTGDTSAIVQLSDQGTIHIKDFTNTIVWTGDGTNKLFIINDNDFFINQQPLVFIPLNTNPSATPTNITVTPSDTPPDIPTLLNDITHATQLDGELSKVSIDIQELNDFVSLSSSIINGGLLLVNTSDTVTIDTSVQTFSYVGFIRGSYLTITIAGSITPAPTIRGECRLIFLGTHFYNSQAKENKNGVAFPFLLLFLWIIALSLFLAFRFFIKLPVREINNKIKKPYAVSFHIIAVVAAFILMDWEISYIFGTSALDAFLRLGFSLFFIAFLLIEFIIWILGYVFFAIPIRIITNSILRFLGIGEAGKGIGKGVGVLFIWVFSLVYGILFINIVLVFFNFGGIFTMG